MKLSGYLHHCGGNNITVAEAITIGIVINPGWPQKYADKEVPDTLGKAVPSTKAMPCSQRRKALKDASSGHAKSQNTDDNADVKGLLYRAAETFPLDPYKAFVFVNLAIGCLRNKRTRRKSGNSFEAITTPRWQIPNSEPSLTYPFQAPALAHI